jgi:type I restriction enzyme, S subunit
MSNATLVSQASALNLEDVELDETSELAQPADQENPSWYPTSIQPGIPRLPALPSGWTRYALGDLLRKVERPATLIDDQTYQLVTAKRSRGGIVPREVLRGDQVLTKTQFYVEAGDFLISNRQISHGACGLVPISLHNAVVSNEYTAFHTSDALDLRFLNALSNSIYFQQTCFHSSIGVHVEKLVFRLEDWLRCRFNIPGLSEQRRIVAVLDSWDEAIRNAEQLRDAHLQRRSGFRTKLLSGRQRLIGHSGKWRVAALHEILHEHGSLSSGQEAVFSVSVHKGLVNQMSHLGRSFAAKQTAHYNRVFPGDIVYTKSPTGEFPFGIVKQSTIAESVIVSPLYGVFTPLTRAIGVIVDAYFEAPIAAKNYLVPLVQKGAKNTIAITNQRFLSGTIALPTNDKEIEELASIMQVSKAAITNLELEIRALRNQKLGLMQRLLTGQTRLDERFDSASLPPTAANAPKSAGHAARKLSGSKAR